MAQGDEAEKDAGTRARRDLVAALAVFLVAIAVRGAFQVHYDARLGLDTRRSPELDCNTFDVWARRIAAGDLLGRDMYHPWHWWAKEIAPVSVWDSWYGKTTFHQAPLYPYLAALAYAVFGADPDPMRRVQAFLGAVSAALAFLLARRFVPRAPALAAGVLVALSGPIVFYELNLLRENLLVLLNLVFLLATERAARSGSARAHFLAGLFLGASVLTKESQLLFLPVLLAAPYAHEALRSAARARRAALMGAASLGLVAALLPVFARNAVVGAPLLKLSTRGPEVIVAGNAASSDGVEWFPERTRGALLEGDARRILNEAEGSLVKTIALTLATHRENPLGFLRLLARKLDAFLNAREVPNNVDFPGFRAALPFLRVLPDFRWIGPLGLAGVFLALARRRARETSSLLVFLAIATLSTVGFFIVGRFRIPYVPEFAVLGAIAVDSLLAFARERRRRALVLALLGLAALVAYEWPRGGTKSEARARFEIAGLLLDSGRVDRGEEQLDAAVGLASESDETRTEVLARAMLAKIRAEIKGDLAGAERHLRAILEKSKSPEESGPALVSLANVRFRETWERRAPAAEKIPEALELYGEAIASDPGPGRIDREWVKTAHYGEGRVLLYCAQTGLALEPNAAPRAVESARRAIAEDPEYAAARALLGQALIAAGRREDGIAELERSLGLFSAAEADSRAQVEALLRDLGRR